MGNSKVFPIILGVIFIVIFVYLFSNLEQPVVECSKSNLDDLNIKVVEELKTKLDGNRISGMELTRTIILPDNYATDESIESIKEVVKKSYAYLDKDSVSYESLSDRLIVKVNVSSKETLILNNIEFMESDGLQIKINSNTKSSDVVTLKVGDNYSEGEFKTRMKNNGYVCS